jgi:hypothetical protein
MEVESDANSRSVTKVHRGILTSVKHMEAGREALVIEIIQYISVKRLVRKAQHIKLLTKICRSKVKQDSALAWSNVLSVASA